MDLLRFLRAFKSQCHHLCYEMFVRMVHEVANGLPFGVCVLILMHIELNPMACH